MVGADTAALDRDYCTYPNILDRLTIYLREFFEIKIIKKCTRYFNMVGNFKCKHYKYFLPKKYKKITQKQLILHYPLRFVGTFQDKGANSFLQSSLAATDNKWQGSVKLMIEPFCWVACKLRFAINNCSVFND